MGTWPQLIGCALFEIWSLISDGELRSRRGYSTGRLEVYEISTEVWEIVPGFPEHLRRQTRKTLDGWVRLKVRESDDTIFRLQIYTKYRCLNTTIGKTIK